MTDRSFSVAVVRRVLIATLVGAATVFAATHVLSAQAKLLARVAAGKAFTTSIVNTDFGSDGARGSFSAKLGSSARALTALLSVATGVPYDQIARGGTYVARIAPSSEAGLAVVTFADHSLGTACVQWAGMGGKYNPSNGFVVVDGSLKLLGGTGAAAHWRGSLTFKQTGVTGTDTLAFGTRVNGSIGPSHTMPATCRAVASQQG
jgi:hypothetical protein